MDKNRKSEALAILSNACARNLPLTLLTIDDTTAVEYHSRFLELKQVRKDTILTIEGPTSKGSLALVQPGQGLRVSFTYNHQRRSFLSRLTGRGRVELNPGTSVPSWELLAPDYIPANERRSFYRVYLPHGSPTEVTMSVLADGSSRVRAREKGILTDIGSGGLGFRLHEGKSLLLGVGVQLLLALKLPESDNQIKLRGRVCFGLRRSDIREVFLGVQFVMVDSGFESKHSLDEVSRFVAAQQIQMLGRRIRANR